MTHGLDVNADSASGPGDQGRVQAARPVT